MLGNPLLLRYDFLRQCRLNLERRATVSDFFFLFAFWMAHLGVVDFGEKYMARTTHIAIRMHLWVLLVFFGPGGVGVAAGAVLVAPQAGVDALICINL